jgi:anaerobic glycerol-3-phosphate dehydrogenase
MNGFTFVEAARVLAESVLADAEDSATQVSRIVERVLSRLPDAREAATLLKQLEATRRHYAAHPAEAVRLAAQGASPVRADLDPVLLAALTVVASTVLNLDEAITRE